MRLALVTDIHHGRVSFTKQGPRAVELLRAGLARAAAQGVDAVIDLGDRISDVGEAADLALESEVGRVFAQSGLARHHVCGNHDRAFLTRAQNAAALDAPLGTRSVEAGEFRLAFWEPDVSLSRTKGFALAEGDLDALAALLATSDKRTLLFTHVPLSGQSMRGNFWFENNPAHAAYRETDAIRDVLAAAPCPILAVAGHVHWNSIVEIDGIRHLTQQSLIDSAYGHPEPAAAFGWLAIEGETVRWRVDGAWPLAAEFPFPARKPRRLRALPVFGALQGEPAPAFQ